MLRGRVWFATAAADQGERAIAQVGQGDRGVAGADAVGVLERRHDLTDQLHKACNKICKEAQRVHARSGMRDNNFDTMRFVAALCVVISHSFPLSYGDTATQPLFLLSHGQTTLGTVSVYIFFVLSGFLITGSFKRQPLYQFVLARGLRLFPGLAVVLFILTFLVGPILTTIPLGEYFRSGKTYYFFAKNLSLTGYVNELPGVFEANSLPHKVDG